MAPGGLVEWSPSTVGGFAHWDNDTRSTSHNHEVHLRAALEHRWQTGREGGRESWLGLAIEFDEPMSVPAIRTALTRWIDRHEVLRSHVVVKHAGLQRLTTPPGSVKLKMGRVGWYARRAPCSTSSRARSIVPPLPCSGPPTSSRRWHGSGRSRSCSPATTRCSRVLAHPRPERTHRALSRGPGTSGAAADAGGQLRGLQCAGTTVGRSGRRRPPCGACLGRLPRRQRPPHAALRPGGPRPRRPRRRPGAAAVVGHAGTPRRRRGEPVHRGLCRRGGIAVRRHRRRARRRLP